MKLDRLFGLDLARFFAFFGMVIVNFQMVMRDQSSQTPNWLESILVLFEGKAAATFVVLAGIGVGLAFQRVETQGFRITMLKRSLFLLAIGLVNMSIFEADIIHYYAFYFALGIWFLPLDKHKLLFLTGGIVLAFPFLNLISNYDTGWDWNNLSYSGLWTPEGFLRNLTFNGWHPIVPWLGFFTFGIFLSKLDLAKRGIAIRIAAIGIVGSIITPIFREASIAFAAPLIGTDAATILGTSPIPPGPFYMLNGMSAASLVVGLCLLPPPTIYQNPAIKMLCKTGQQTLTLYFAHILIGMGIIEMMGLISATSSLVALNAAALFVAASIIYVTMWNLNFKRGPLEELMRRTTG